MSRKTIAFKLSPAAPVPAAVESEGTRESWIAGAPALYDADPPACEADSGPEHGRAASAAQNAFALAAPFLFPASAAFGRTVLQGSEEIGRIWSEAAWGDACRRMAGMQRLVRCWTVPQALALQGELASENLADALAVTADLARVAERTTRAAAESLSPSRAGGAVGPHS